MIESGLYQWVVGNPALQPLLGQLKAEKAKGVWSAYFFSALPKPGDDPVPGIVADVLKSDELDTLDARSAGPPYSPVTRVFQIGCVAQDQQPTGPINPWNPSGYLSASYLALTLYRQLIGLATGRSALPDGSIIQNVEYLDEYDAHYEQGGTAYLFRRIFQVAITYIPSSGDPPAME